MEEVNRKFEEFIKSGKYKDILIMMGNLGKYSLTNQVYILLQNLNTSFVNGMRGWNYLGRSIKKYGFSQVGCPVRIGSTTKEMPVMEIEMRYKKRFESSNDYMTKRRAAYGGITFASLKIALSTKGFHINDESFAINYNLLLENGEYNQLAELLSDKNNLHIIFAKFRGKDKTSMSERNDFGRQSVINSYFALKTRLQGISVPRNLSFMRVFQNL